jgi:uncharacterized protein (DUF486 family)
MQEIVTLCVVADITMLCFGTQLRWNHSAAFFVCKPW